MPLKQLAYVPNHIDLSRRSTVDLLVKPAMKVNKPSTIQVKLSGKHADELYCIGKAGFARSKNNPPKLLFGFSLTIDEDAHGSSVLGQL